MKSLLFLATFSLLLVATYSIATHEDLTSEKEEPFQYQHLVPKNMILSPHEAKKIRSLWIADPFNLNIARNNVYMSYAAYCPSQAINDWNCYWCNQTGPTFVTQIIYNQNTNTFGYISVQNNTIFVTFRGTMVTSINNWISNLKVAKTMPYGNVPTASVHKGFYEAYMGVATTVRQAFAQTVSRCNQCNRIIFSGHSLGAALTTLAALDLIQMNLVTLPFTVYHFGAPRVGNEGFAFYARSTLPLWRMVNENDIVAHLPPQILGFRHPPTEIFEKGANYRQCSSSNGEDSSCADGQLLPVSIPDHFNYMQIAKSNGAPYGCPV